MTVSRPPFVIMESEAVTPAIGLSASAASNGDDAAAGLLCLHLFDRELSDVNEARQVRGDQSVKSSVV